MQKDSTNFNIKPDEWEFEFQQREMHPAIMTDLWLRAIRDHMSIELDFSVKSPDYLFTDAYKGYVKVNDKKLILKKLREKIESPDYLQYLFDKTMAMPKKIDSVMEKCTQNLSENLSKKELAERWRTVEESYLETIPWFYIPWYVTEENMLSDRVKSGLEKYRKEIEKLIDFNTALGILLFPAKEAIFQKEQRDFFRLVKKLQNNESIDSNIEKHLADYSWIKTFFLLPVEPLTKDELLKRIDVAVQENQLDQYELQEKKKAEYDGISKKLFALLKNNKELLTSIEIARELVWILTASVEEGTRAASKLLPFCRILAKALDMPYESWVHLTSKEIYDCLLEDKKVSLEEISNRGAATAAIMQNGVIKWMWGDEAKGFSEHVESGVGKIDMNVREFRGQPAFKGKTTGEVRIALTPKDSNDLVAGEILVTSMTSPDYVPAMRRSAAIITNEGGLLSHAAIMSREFGKPCIVGTKVATKLLKNGVTVEVDADNGIIRILKT